MPKIFLIGMPGSGKSTIGKILAAELGYSFLDLDTEIEKNEGINIEVIFELKGEKYFRKLEAQALSFIAKTKGNFIIATGGGTPFYYDGLALMQKVGKTVFIHVSLEEIINRLQADYHRPLLKGGVEKKIKELYIRRIEGYSKAKIIIEADKLSQKKLVKLIKTYIQP